MFAPLLSVVAVLALALVVLLIRAARVRSKAQELPARLATLDTRVSTALSTAERTLTPSVLDTELPRPETSERRPGRRRVRRPASPPAPLDRP